MVNELNTQTGNNSHSQQRDSGETLLPSCLHFASTLPIVIVLKQRRARLICLFRNDSHSWEGFVLTLHVEQRPFKKENIMITEQRGAKKTKLFRMFVLFMFMPCV